MRTSIKLVILGCVALLAGPASATVVAQDVITIGTGVTSANTVDVPVYIRDTSGTPLGLDQPPGSRIQSYSIKVNYAPASAIQSVTFTRAGITQSLTPTFESSPASAGSISLLDTFHEATNLIPFTLNGALPGDKVAHLVFTFAPATLQGTVVTLTLDPTLTQLTDEGGSPGTKETVSGGTLLLVNGSIVQTQDIPLLDARFLLLLGAVLTIVAFRARA
jgi:hypothetical protein